MADPVSSFRRSYRLRSKRKANTDDDNASESNANENSSEPKHKKAKIRKQALLSNLPDLPLDLLFCIFSLLHPADLVNLTRANKLLRSALLAPDAIFVWRATREATGAPAPLKDITESSWCKLIFGGPYCQVCGTRTSKREIDWAIRKRLCQTCVSHMVMRGSYDELHAGVEEHLILPLVVPLGDSPEQFLLEDVKKIIEEWEYHKASATSQGSDSFDSWIEERRKWVQEVTAHASACEVWHTKAKEKLEEEKRQIAKSRADELIRRLVELGHARVDASIAVRESGEGQYNGKTQAALTDQVWNRLQRNLLRRVGIAKADRQAREIKDAKSRRQNDFKWSYRGYLNQFPPAVWALLPEPRTVAEWPSVQKVINTEPFTDVVSFTDVLAGLPQEIEAWKASYQREITKSTRLTISNESGGRPHVLAGRRAVGLAATVYTRGQLNPAVTWDEIARLQSRYLEDDPSPTIFNEALSEVSVHLIRLAGLDPRKAKVEEMTALAQDFVCKCSFRVGVWDRPRVMNWREALAHHHTVHHDGSAIPYAEYRTLEAKEKVETLTSWTSTFVGHWICGHCNTNLRNGNDTEARVCQHVEREHNISSPQAGVDYLQGQGVNALSETKRALAYRGIDFRTWWSELCSQLK